MQQPKRDIRRRMRQRRQQLPQGQRDLAASRLAEHLLQSAPFQQARRVACFLSADGEINTEPILQAAWNLEKEVFLPVLQAGRALHLGFRAYQPDSAMQRNRYGILEPAAGELLTGDSLDLVLTPLVAFDATGNRLGMGGGYYDRTFVHLERRPKLLGIAYAFQQTPNLPTEPWDVPLWGVVTEQGLQRFAADNT